MACTRLQARASVSPKRRSASPPLTRSERRRRQTKEERLREQSHDRVEREQSAEIQPPPVVAFRQIHYGSTSSVASVSTSTESRAEIAVGREEKICCVSSCKNAWQTAAVVHSFPDSKQQPSRRRGWIARINAVGLGGVVALSTARLETNPSWGICGLHFPMCDYSARPDALTGTKGMLKLNAVPSIFAGDFSTKASKLSEVRKKSVPAMKSPTRKENSPPHRFRYPFRAPSEMPIASRRKKSVAPARAASVSSRRILPRVAHPALSGKGIRKITAPRKLHALMAAPKAVTALKRVAPKTAPVPVARTSRIFRPAAHVDEYEENGEVGEFDEYHCYEESIEEEQLTGAEEFDDDEELVPLQRPALKLILAKAPVIPAVDEEDEELLFSDVPLRIVLQKTDPLPRPSSPLPVIPFPVKISVDTKLVQVDSFELEPDETEEEITEILAEAQEEILELRLTLESTELDLHNERDKVAHLEGRVAAWIGEHYYTAARETERLEMMDNLANYYLARANKAETEKSGLSARVELHEANFVHAQKQIDNYRAQIMELQASHARQMEVVMSSKQKESKQYLGTISTLRRQLTEHALASSDAKKAFEIILREYKVPVPDTIKDLNCAVTTPKPAKSRKQVAREAAKAAVAPSPMPVINPNLVSSDKNVEAAIVAPAVPVSLLSDHDKNAALETPSAPATTSRFHLRNTRQRAKDVVQFMSASQSIQTTVIQSTPSASAIPEPHLDAPQNTVYSATNPKKRARAARSKAAKTHDDEGEHLPSPKKPRESSVDRAVRYLMAL